MNIEFNGYMIRDWRLEDAPHLAKYADNRKIWINLRDGFPSPYTIRDAECFLARSIKLEPPTVFAIATPKEAIGSIGVSIGKDVHRFTAEMGYWLAEPFWNMGIMTAAIRNLIAYLFATHKLHRIYAEPYLTNPASARVLEKAGFICEGILKGNAFKNGLVLDQWLYAIVNGENTQQAVAGYRRQSAPPA